MIGGAILQNQLTKRLPAAFQSELSEGVELAYAAIPRIESLAEPLRTDVRVAFAQSMAVIGRTMLGIGGLGCLTLLLLKEVPMGVKTDEKYGLEVKGKEGMEMEECVLKAGAAAMVTGTGDEKQKATTV